MFTTGVLGGSFGTLVRWANRNETGYIAKKSSSEAFSRKVIRWATSVRTQGPMSKAQPRTTVVHDTVFVSFMKIRDVDGREANHLGLCVSRRKTEVSRCIVDGNCVRHHVVMIRYDARWCVSKDTEKKRPGLPSTCGHVVHLGQNLCDALSVSLDRNSGDQ